MKRFIPLTLGLLALLLVGTSVQAQSPYGYKGKRLYLSYDLSASLALLRYSKEGEFRFPNFNFINNVSLNMVTNKTTVIGLNYRFYQDVASVANDGVGGIFDSPVLDNDMLTHQPFSTYEMGFGFTWFTSDLNAPLGKYVTLGLGMAVSNFANSFRVTTSDKDYLRSQSRANGDIPDPDEELILYDNTRPIVSPIIRTSLGGQQLFFDRFFINGAIEFGLNLGYFATLGSTGFILDGSGSQEQDEETVRIKTRNAVQHRVFFKNLMNFKVGAGVLLF